MRAQTLIVYVRRTGRSGGEASPLKVVSKGNVSYIYHQTTTKREKGKKGKTGKKKGRRKEFHAR